MNPTRLRALSDAYGSWNTIIMFLRSGRISRRETRDLLSLVEDAAPVGSSSLRMHRTSVDFPHPDSPTMPSVSPSRSENEMPSTAFTVATSFWKMIPRVTGKCFFRSSTTRSSLPPASLTCPPR